MMSKLEELIFELCPNGVEYKKLGEIGNFYGGLSGKTKNDFANGNARFITYMDVYLHPSIGEISGIVEIAENEHQNNVECGDVFFTGSSETPDECAISSVLTENVDSFVYLNSFCFGYRLNDKQKFDLDFLKHLFRSDFFRKQIPSATDGVTRFNVSKKKFANLVIPIPPLKIQKEIANTLDKFSLLEEELEEELEERRKQYGYYRNELLTFDNLKNKVNVSYKKLGDVCKLVRGEGLSKADKGTGNIPIILYGELYTTYGSYITEVYSKASAEVIKNSPMIRKGDLLLPISSTTKEAQIGKVSAYCCDYDAYLGGDALLLQHNQYPNYLVHLLNSSWFEQMKMKCTRGTTINHLNPKQLAEIEIPVPPIEIQKRIADILDNFEKICMSLNIGLPAEIEARQKQYEYYRDMLLQFTPVVDERERERA